MRQYSRGRRNIATNIGAMALATVLTSAAAAADDALPDHQWHREMAAAAIQQQVLPPVQVSGLAAEGSIATADVRVQPWFKGHSADFVLVLPPGEITSASLAVTETTAADPSRLVDGTTATVSREIPATVRHLGYVRGNRLVKIQMMTNVPGAPGERMLTGRLSIAYSSDVTMSSATSPTTADDDTDFFQTMLEKLVANPADLGRLAQPLDSAPPPGDESPVPIGGYPDAVARFEVAEDGFVQFTGSDLAAAGVDISQTDVNHVGVWSNGEQQPVYSSGLITPHRSITPADWFRVYAHDNDSTYTATRDYWVRVTNEPPLPMDAGIGGAAGPQTTNPAATFTATRRIEEDIPPVLTKNDQFLTILGYRWVWWTWTPSPVAEAGVPGARSYDTSGSLNFDLDGLASQSPATADLTLHFYSHRWSMTSAPVEFRVEVNGKAIQTIVVSDPSGLEHTLKVPASELKARQNTLVITPKVNPGPHLPELCFDRLDVSYPRTYAMTSNTLEFGPPTINGGTVGLNLDDSGETSVMVADITGEAPRLLFSKGGPINNTLYINTEGPSTRRYLAFTPDAVRRAELTTTSRTINLLSTDNQADLVVVAWPDFMADLQPWIDNKKAKGHAVKVVNVFDVYDQFGYGHESPHAIRAFLRHAMIHWKGSARGPAASAVVLVGDSTSAYRNEFRNDVINYVPTMRLNVNGDAFASDQWFVSLFGDDAFSDALVGRFSVNNREDLRTVIQKQLDYEKNSASGTWQNTLGFIADHSEFEESIDRVMKQVVPPRFFLDRIMMSELPWVDNYYFPKEIADARKAKVSPQATGRIRDLFNNGAAVVTYFGHGSPNIWSNERMWFGGDSPNSDNLMLTNRDKLAIVINMTCNSGAIDYPQPRWNVAISEDFMRVKNGGAVACFVPSGPGLTVQHERLMMEVGRLLFNGAQPPLGQTLQLSLWRYLAGGNPSELAQMYIYLGDPLLLPGISKPVDDENGGRRAGASWPGTVALPPDVVGSTRGGSYQFNDYGKVIEPGVVSNFTSATVALPVPPAPPDDAARVVALAVPDDVVTTQVEATFQPVSGVHGVRLVQWRRLDAADEDATATLEFQLKNETPLPLRGVSLQLLHDESGQVMAASGPLVIMGFAEYPVKVDIPTSPGLTPLRPVLVHGETRNTLEAVSPVGVVGLRPDGKRNEIPPATVDPRSVSVRYRNSENAVAATVSAQIHVLSLEALSNLRVGLEDATGLVLQDSVMTVPPVKPGDNVRISMTAEMSPEAPSQEYAIRFDPSGYYPEFARHPSVKVALGRPHFADLVVGEITASNSAPTEGETVFFDVEVGNAGDALADGVRVEGFRSTTSTELVELESQVTLNQPLLSMEPGTSENVRLRWDPFQNAGTNNLAFTAKSIYEMPDRTMDNNSRSMALNVNTKARLRRVKVGVLPIRPEDLKARQVRFLARVTNEGQSEAHGLRVRYYSSPAMTEAEFLGEAELERINPGETKDVILTYQVKPGEEDRPINISFEVVFKGSRQRVPMD